jgi:hypothetical protein
MSAERTARRVERWVRRYTAGLPRAIADRRIEEIRADLHEQITYERSLGRTERSIARRLAGRSLRGAPADVAWRADQLSSVRHRTMKEQQMRTHPVGRSAAFIGMFVVTVLAVPLVAMATGADVSWSVTDFVLAGALLAVIGTCADVAWRRRGSLAISAFVAAAGAAAVVAGELDDAPGLVLLGILLVGGGAAIAFRRLQPLR